MPTETPNTPRCLVCQRDDATVPLLTLTYQGAPLWICPQHLPILIHHPAQLIGIVPGAENLEEADHDDHD